MPQLAHETRLAHEALAFLLDDELVVERLDGHVDLAVEEAAASERPLPDLPEFSFPDSLEQRNVRVAELPILLLDAAPEQRSRFAGG